MTTPPIRGASYLCYDKAASPYGCASVKTRDVSYFRSNGNHIVTIPFEPVKVYHTRLDPKAKKPKVAKYTVADFCINNQTFATNFILFYDIHERLISGEVYHGQSIPPSESDMQPYLKKFNLGSAHYCPSLPEKDLSSCVIQ